MTAAHSRDEVERIVRQYLDSYSSKNKAQNMEVIHPDHVFAFPEMKLVDPAFEQRGRDAHEMAWDADTDFMVDLEPRVDEFFIDGDVAITVGSLIASKVGTNPMTGEGPRECRIDTPFTAIWEIDAHTVKRVRWYYDMTLMYMVQLEMDPKSTIDAFTAIGEMLSAGST